MCLMTKVLGGEQAVVNSTLRLQRLVLDLCVED